ncbi:hypothetical protein KUTeg_001273 [Tegillarca granosa]|uniref:Uncharacterized protein n=1 Tax=Tegillarca granosa TaxID=220873 RepID=A0ABQ9FZM5_TEGGR|nr:hypothetical protein KUTeg_001273 [Tegillarca granosa]
MIHGSSLEIYRRQLYAYSDIPQLQELSAFQTIQELADVNLPVKESSALNCQAEISNVKNRKSHTSKEGKLTRHIKRKHKHEEEVKEILKLSNKEQNQCFDKKRREGIYEFNLKKMSLNKDPAMRERQPKHKDEVRVCSDCRSFILSKYFSKHTCIAENPQAQNPKLIKSAETEMHHDKELRMVRQRVGFPHFNLRRHEESKQDEVRKLVMSEMRELARLFLIFRTTIAHSESVTAESMFSRQYLSELRQSVDELVKKEEINKKIESNKMRKQMKKMV